MIYPTKFKHRLVNIVKYELSLLFSRAEVTNILET